MTQYLPLFLKADERTRALVVGGGEIAAAKIEALASVGMHVEVVGESLSAAVIDLCERHGYAYQQGRYHATMLAGKRVVVAATNDRAINEMITFDCYVREILVNVVDAPALCDFIFPALVRRGPLQIAISTSGIAPVLARLIKHAIEAAVPAQFERLIEFMDDKKSLIRKRFKHIQPRRLFYEAIIRGAIAEDVLEGNDARADAQFSQALLEHEDHHQAALYLVGAGPGNPELITLKAIRLLSQADVVMYDRLVSSELIDQYVRKDAEKICVGKTRNHHLKSQDAIDELIEEHLLCGRIVVRLKGGDPGVYAHGAEEVAIAKKLHVPYHIVPGITAASGCAAYAGVPLTERDGAQSVRFLTVYKKHMHDAHFWQGLRYAKEETLVFYMSSHHLGSVCDKLIASGFATDTPFLAIEQGTTPYHKEYPGTLSTFHSLYADHSFASPCLVIVGSVVNWQKQHAWKQPPQQDGEYFIPLSPQESARV